jgi:hypothetical protein
MKKGDTIYWLKFTMGGELSFYKAEYIQLAKKSYNRVKLIEMVYDNSVPQELPQVADIHFRDLFTMNSLIEIKEKLFRMIFVVLPERRNA